MLKGRTENIFFFLIYVLFRPKLWFLLTTVHVPTYIQLLWVKRFNIRTYIDVGAHEGQEVNVIKTIEPECEIYAFEPQKKLIPSLELNTADNIHIIHSAIGSANGETTLLVPQYTPGASILKPGNYLKGELGKLHREKVTILTLDTFFADISIKKPSFLKIDTQGYELEVLKGAQKTLSKIDIIYIETPLEKSYEESCVFDEIYTFLTKKGFIYQGVMSDGQFAPKFEIPDVQNSIFVKKSFSVR